MCKINKKINKKKGCLSWKLRLLDGRHVIKVGTDLFSHKNPVISIFFTTVFLITLGTESLWLWLLWGNKLLYSVLKNVIYMDRSDSSYRHWTGKKFEVKGVLFVRVFFFFFLKTGKALLDRKGRLKIEKNGRFPW